jgi:hypothetical protein
MKAGKAIPSQAWTDPEGSRRLRHPVSWQSAYEGGKVVRSMHRPPLPPPPFLLEAESTTEPQGGQNIVSENFQ